MEISIVIGVNPLQTTQLERGIVSGRVALLLRSAEIQPLFVRFVINSIIDVEYYLLFIDSYPISVRLSDLIEVESARLLNPLHFG